MNILAGTLKNILRFSAILGILAVFIPGSLNAQIGIQSSTSSNYVRIFEQKIVEWEQVGVDSSLFRIVSGKLKRTVELDSIGQFISIRESLNDTEFFYPTILDLHTYVQLRLEHDLRTQWKKQVVAKIQKQQEAGFGAITLDIPFRIKSKTFTRIFGSDRIGLRVTGNISFDLSGRTEERSGSAVSALENQNTFSPRFSQTQQFTVEGHIGEKVSVSVEQNSEAVTEIENTLKLRYKGDEDEIVQSIEAGNISLSLPSTKYVIFGGSNKGLFGLKTQMQIGNLHFTGVASLEKGEQKELTISGSSKESEVTIKDTDFIKNRYFFVDTLYRDSYENGLKDDPLIWRYEPGSDILQINIWVSVPQADENQRYGLAVIDPDEYDYQSVDELDGLTDIDGLLYKRYFRRLQENEYTLDQYRGIVTLKQSVSSSQVLAVSYLTSDKRQVGTLEQDLAGSEGATSRPVIARLIKAFTPKADYKQTWTLMLRNVYSLGGTQIEEDGFDVRLEYNVTGNHDRFPENEAEKSFLHLTGLDRVDENGNIVQNGDEIIDKNGYLVDRANGILFFPALQPFNSDGDYAIPDKYRVDMYNLNDNATSDFNEAHQFDLIVKSKSTKSTFDLGFYVLESSEVVTLGGQTLQRDKDYMIDYFSGQLTLLSPEAKRSSSSINIKYERANLFQLDKKTIFGGRLEYKLWDGGFIGLTAIYLNKSTLDRRVRVGQEPFSNFVWDINAAFKFKPRFLTRFMDAMPIIETNAESQFDVEAEFAQVIPNPNSLNNPSTGDNNGVAYIDDFESSKRTTTLGIRYRNWTMASSPVRLPNLDEVIDLDPADVDNARGHIAWFNPYQQEHINNIWPNRDVNSQTGQTTDVLGIEFWRDPGSDPDSSWVGFMRSTASFPDQSKTKFLELWVKGKTGTINIDIGEISEDWYLKGETQDGRSSKGGLNKEDKNLNSLLDDGEDIGIDGVAGTSWDKWAEPRKDERFPDGWRYDQINGTEGNGNSREARYPDTEDLNGDDQLSTSNNYFQYRFSLRPEDSLEVADIVAGATPQGWRQFRIPLNKWIDKVGFPDERFQQIYSIRFWISDLPEAAEDEVSKRARIKIATFDFVGNEWEETGIAENDSAEFSLEDSIFVLETYNTEENLKSVGDRPPYTSPPGVSGVRDRITNALSKEQALAMRVIGKDKGLGLSGGQVAEAKKTLYNSMDLSNYERLRMFIHGYDNSDGQDFLPFSPESGRKSKINIYVRFGSDANNYYEYGQEVYQGWHPINEMNIVLDDMVSVKYNTYPINPSDVTPIFVDSLPDVPGGYYKAYNQPSVKTIRYFIVGIKNNGHENEIFNGELWLDELRLSDVRKEKATALRLKANFKLADILSVNAQWESVDADFHNVGTQFGKGSTNETQSYSGKINVDKLLPGFLNISFPIDARANFRRSIPKYLPRTDKLSGYQNSTVEEKIASLFGAKKLNPTLAKQVNQSEVYGIGTTIKKRTKSKNFLIRYTIDELLLDMDYSYKHSSNWETRFNNSEQYKTAVTYQIPFGKDNFITPLSFTKGIPLLKLLSDQKLYYLPGSMKFALSVMDAKTVSQRRQKETSSESIPLQRTINTSTNRSINSSYKMLESLNFTYSRSHATDADADTLSHRMLWQQIFKNLYFGRETSINQSFKGNFKPKMFSWLKPNYAYSSTYRYQLQSLKYKNTNQSVSHRVGLTFNPGTLLKSIYNPKRSKSSSGSGRSRRRPGRSQTKNNDEGKSEEKSEETKPEGGKSMFPNPLMLLYDAVASWSSIESSLTIDNKVAHRYLSDMPSWEYQFGISDDPGVPVDSSLDVQLTPPTYTSTMRISNRTSFNIMKLVRINLKHDYNKSEDEREGGNIRTGNRSRTYLILGDDPLESFSDFNGDIAGFIPDWTVQISGIEKFLFFPKFAKTISIDHGRTGKVTQRMRLSTDGLTYAPGSTAFTSSWSPLLGITLNTIWGVKANMRMTNTVSLTDNAAAGATKTKTSKVTLTLNYAMTAGIKIPIPVWPFKGRTFKNEMNFSLTFDSANNTSFQKQFDSPDFEEKQKTTNWKLRPSATYRFSSRVQGSLFYETSTSENKISGKYSYNEFGVSVNIAIRD